MRILHVISSVSPKDGGPPEMTHQLAMAYFDEGKNVEVVCQDKPGSKYLERFSCPVHAMGERWLGRYAFSPKLCRWLDENIKRFDGIVVQGIWTFQCLAVRHYARKHNVKYCVFIHGALDPWFKHEYPLKHLKKALYWPIQYGVLRDANVVFFTSQKELDLALESFRPNQWNGVIFPYGIRKPHYDDATAADAFLARMPQMRGKRFLLYLARIHPKKGCDLLLKAFAKYAEQFPDVDLVMAGPDQVGWQPSLQHMCKTMGIADRVHWPGHLGGECKWGALRAAEVFVLPSHQENFGIAVVESLAAGRPVLITNQVNIWEEIETDGAGMADDDTEDGVTRLLGKWFNLPEAARHAMATAADACFKARYALDRGVRCINDTFLS